MPTLFQTFQERMALFQTLIQRETFLGRENNSDVFSQIQSCSSDSWFLYVYFSMNIFLFTNHIYFSVYILYKQISFSKKIWCMDVPLIKIYITFTYKRLLLLLALVKRGKSTVTILNKTSIIFSTTCTWKLNVRYIKKTLYF